MGRRYSRRAGNARGRAALAGLSATWRLVRFLDGRALRGAGRGERRSAHRSSAAFRPLRCDPPPWAAGATSFLVCAGRDHAAYLSRRITTRSSLYDDDGETNAYRAGGFAWTTFSVEQLSGGLALRIAPGNGDPDVITPERTYSFRILRVRDAKVGQDGGRHVESRGAATGRFSLSRAVAGRQISNSSGDPVWRRHLVN